MKRIRVFRNLGAGLPAYAEGQVVDVSDEECERLVTRGLAEVIRAVPPATELVTGVPPAMQIAPPADPEPAVDQYEQSRRQPGRAKRSKRVHKE